MKQSGDLMVSAHQVAAVVLSYHPALAQFRVERIRVGAVRVIGDALKESVRGHAWGSSSTVGGGRGRFVPHQSQVPVRQMTGESHGRAVREQLWGRDVGGDGIVRTGPVGGTGRGGNGAAVSMRYW